MSEERARTRSTGLGGITNLAVMAPIKAGMVPSFEPISYLKRIEKVLDALQSSRQNLRESELLRSFFPDTVGRFSMFHNFRYALMPPRGPDGKVVEEGQWCLSLNVTFDGGWEPYMRVVYRDIGPLLDLLFCHNDTYPTSRASFEKYCDWVRANEIGGGIFYVDSDMSLGDQHYLARLEQTARDKKASEADIAQVALESSVERAKQALKDAQDNPESIVLPLRTLKGLYRLTNFFPPQEMDILRHFAQYVLQDAMAIMRWADKLQPSADPVTAKWLELWGQAKFGMGDELKWLQYPAPYHPPAPQARQIDAGALQSHILVQDTTVTHGCLVLLGVEQAEDAVAYLSSLDQRCGPVPVNGVGYTVALTYPGLEALGISQSQLATFPQEFVEGMERRCGILGDVRGNHPDRWRLPPLHGQAKGKVEMKTVHACILLRRADANSTAQEHPDFAAEIQALNDSAKTGLRVLATQFTRSYRKNGQTRDHFKFTDGISQPDFPAVGTNPPQGAVYDNKVRAGELLAGYDTGRGDAAENLTGLLKDGSFLVARKLRQRVDNLQKVLGTRTETEAEALLAKMMGRRYDGTPLAKPSLGAGANDFDHTAQDSNGCPFHAHTRRANPRDGRPYTPRILRRGMSYGPQRPETGETDADRDADRGVVFMAYCASISEQFETIQRWLTGGNSSGVASSQPDPLLHVPQKGQPYTFRYLDDSGQVQRVSLGEEPMVELQWGLYLFVPAREALQKLKDFRIEPPPANTRPSQQPADALEVIRARLEDHDQAKKEWAKVRAGSSDIRKTAYGELVGTSKEVLDIMRDDGTQYSVSEYGKRKSLSVGLNLLGIDHANQHKELPTNAAILTIKEPDAFKAAQAAVAATLQLLPKLPDERQPIDLVTYSDLVLAMLCAKWIGLPDEKQAFLRMGGRVDANPAQARCPGNLTTASRFIFTPHPRAELQQEGPLQGGAVLTQIKKWLQSADPKLGPLAQGIRQGLVQSGAITEPAVGPAAPDEVIDTLARNISGVMVGFTPTVQGNFLTVMKNWIENQKLWQVQQDVWQQSPGTTLDYAEANAALRDALFDAMREDPVPGMLYRTRVGAADPQNPTNRVVLGIASALAGGAPDGLIFGRDRSREPAVDGSPDTTRTVHGCPGYSMAMGVLFGMIGALLKAGTLRPTGSPVLLILTP